MPHRLTPILLALAGLAFLYFAMAAIQGSLRLYHLQRQEEAVQSELAGVEWDHQRLEILREYLNSDEYIEGRARRTLGWVRPGEKEGIIVITPEGESQKSPAPARRWWEVFFEE